MDKPAVYRIRVKGILPDSAIDRLGGMEITVRTSDSVTIEGRVTDQAALVGVLNTLYELRLPIQEVTLIPLELFI
jgi:hypothetical protein